MSDLPVASRALALRCYQAAKAAGLHHVRIGCNDPQFKRGYHGVNAALIMF